MDFKEWRRQHEGKAENETVNGADGSTVNKPEASPATEEMMPVSQNGERAELQIADEATHSVALESARNRLGDEDVTRISGELTRIAALELESFDMLQQSGNLPAKTIAEHRELRNSGIDCGQFTPDEIHEIRQFAADATPEIRERKFEMLSNVVTNTRFGAYGERTKNRDPEKAARLNWIADKLALFDEGKFLAGRRARWRNTQSERAFLRYQKLYCDERENGSGRSCFAFEQIFHRARQMYRRPSRNNQQIYWRRYNGDFRRAGAV